MADSFSNVKFRVPLRFVFAVFLGSLTACANISTGAHAEKSASAPLRYTDHSQKKQIPAAELERRLKIPVELNPAVERWIDYFTKKDHERFQRFLDRGQKYREVVETVLEESDLPAELYYLAMIESGFQTHATSHAKAVGVWQFIAGTGKRYGLRVDRYVDERRDPIRATEAAAKYLRDLYNVFGSWHLAMAAYNAGEIRILRAIMKGRTRDFWELARLGTFPTETANYVPKFLAVTIIGRDPEKYGFRLGSDDFRYPDLETVEVPSSVPLQFLADKAGIPLPVLKKVNPHLLTSSTPPGSAGYEVWVPEGAAGQVTAVRKTLDAAAKRYSAVASLSKKKKPLAFHTVHRGETLLSIAHKYKISVGHLMRINKLKSTRIYAGARLRTQLKAYKASKTVRYKVRRGDNLTFIARRFKTTPRKIKAQNKLTRSKVFVGQVLKIVRNN